MLFEVIVQKVFDGAVLITRKGLVDGAIQEDIEPQYPKNVGRANETSPLNQAAIMARSKVNKLKDKGYKELDDTMSYQSITQYLMSVEGTDANNNLLPMLAQKDTDKITFPGYLQRKLDGLRCIARKNLTHEDSMRSRYGKFWPTLSHILESLPRLPSNWEYDGEIYHHDRSLQQINSMVKREQPSNLELGYRIYDIMGTGLPYKTRKSLLHKFLMKNRKDRPHIGRVKSYRVHSFGEVDTLFEQFREEGYEGAMWRDPYGLYENGRRSWGLIKYKDFEEEDFEIVGVEEATGRDVGTAIFACITDDGKEFTVRPMGTRAVRREYLDNFEDKYLGELLTVRFQNWTDEGKPFHHRGVVVRRLTE